MTGLKLIRMLELLGTSSPVQTPNRGFASGPTGDSSPSPWQYADGVRGEENTPSAEVYSHHVVICTFGHVSATFWSFYCKICTSKYSKWLPPVALGTLKTREWKTRHQFAGVENARVEIAGVWKVWKAKISKRGFWLYWLSTSCGNCSNVTAEQRWAE